MYFLHKILAKYSKFGKYTIYIDFEKHFECVGMTGSSDNMYQYRFFCVNRP